MQSAFGVEHPESVSKVKPQIGFRPKFGNATSVPKVMGRSYRASQKKGIGAFNSGVNALASGIRHSPGTAIATGLTGAAGVGGLGYLSNRN
jgi:hypothetical protein